jgi:hypothetical protein
VNNIITDWNWDTHTKVGGLLIALLIISPVVMVMITPTDTNFRSSFKVENSALIDLNSSYVDVDGNEVKDQINISNQATITPGGNATYNPSINAVVQNTNGWNWINGVNWNYLLSNTTTNYQVGLVDATIRGTESLTKFSTFLNKSDWYPNFTFLDHSVRQLQINPELLNNAAYLGTIGSIPPRPEHADFPSAYRSVMFNYLDIPEDANNVKVVDSNGNSVKLYVTIGRLTYYDGGYVRGSPPLIVPGYLSHFQVERAGGFFPNQDVECKIYEVNVNSISSNGSVTLTLVSNDSLNGLQMETSALCNLFVYAPGQNLETFNVNFIRTTVNMENPDYYNVLYGLNVQNLGNNSTPGDGDIMKVAGTTYTTTYQNVINVSDSLDGSISIDRQTLPANISHLEIVLRQQDNKGVNSFTGKTVTLQIGTIYINLMYNTNSISGNWSCVGTITDINTGVTSVKTWNITSVWLYVILDFYEGNWYIYLQGVNPTLSVTGNSALTSKGNPAGQFSLVGDPVLVDVKQGYMNNKFQIYIDGTLTGN